MRGSGAARRARPLAPAGAGQPAILLFGDSHSYAVQRAIEKRLGKGRSAQVKVHRLLKEKNGKPIGDTSFEAFLRIVSRLDEKDVVISMIGGNQHAVLSTIQHPQPLDFFTPEAAPRSLEGVQIIPYRTMFEIFSQGLRKGDAKMLEALRKATAARVIHVIPPPPKQDNAFIEQFHESLFAREGLAARGVSPAELRLKFWTLQTRVLVKICKELGIKPMMPPRLAVDEGGFLRPDYYANDATHANWLYGERLLREIERRYLPQERAEPRG